MNASFEQYLRRVEMHLYPLDPSRRAELLLELRHHLEDSAARFMGESEDDRARNAVARMGPPDEVGKALVRGDRSHSPRNALLATLPFALLVVAGIVDFHTAYNHSFVTAVLLACLGVSLRYWGEPVWPVWSASWAGFASMLPLAIAITESPGGSTSFILTLPLPIAVISLLRQQGHRHVLLAIGGTVWVAVFVVLRVSQFSSGLTVMGLIPMLAAVYAVRQYKRRSSIQTVQ